MSLLNVLGDLVAALSCFAAEFFRACIGELYRRRRRIHATTLILLTACSIIVWASLQTAAEIIRAGPAPPLTQQLSSPPPPPQSKAETPSRSLSAKALAVTIRSQHTGKFWQVISEGPGRTRISASASPQQRGLESTVFLLEHEGDPDSGGWALLRWLKTRQLLEAVPAGVPGREDDAWSVRLSDTTSVNDLHKLLIEDDATHSQSHIWSFGLRGYLNQLETSGDIIGHGDSLPPMVASEPPSRGAVAVEKLQSGAAWLMDALEQRDRQLDALQEQLNAARAELMALSSHEPTPGRPVGSRGGPRIAEGSEEGKPQSEGSTVGTEAARADAVGVQTAPQRRNPVHISCPTDGAPHVSVPHSSGGNGDRSSDDAASSHEEEVLNATAGCSARGVPLWSYMGGNEYLRFVRAIASRLRLASGDALLDLAAGDCGASALAIQQLYRGRLQSLALLPGKASARRFQHELHSKSKQQLGLYSPQVNACAVSTARLGWLPAAAFDAAITFGAFAHLRSRGSICNSYRDVLRSIRPGGRFIIADAEHTSYCATRSHDDTRGRVGIGSNTEDDACGGSCHWRVQVPLAFWLACTPMDMEVAVSAIEHTDLPGTTSHACASRHFALLAQRASTPHELRVTAEAGSDGGKIAVLVSLSAQSADGQLQRRVQHLKETSVDNKRMVRSRTTGLPVTTIEFLHCLHSQYCGLHGYSLIIGEDLHHGRHADWDKVKLLAAQHANYEWLLWVPLDTVFADAASSLSALTDDGRAHLIVVQDGSGDGMGTGVLTEPILVRGKSEWSRKLLEEWWGFFTDGFGGTDREALQLILTNMHEEERARRVRIIQPEAVFAAAVSAEPPLWQAAYTPPALLVSFDADAVGLTGAAERSAGGAVACPMQSSDRQMLRCLHAFTSHHLKSIQAADARYHPPAVFDVLASSTAVTTTEINGGDEKSSDASSSVAAGHGASDSISDGSISDGGGASDFDLAGGWLIPRLSSGQPSARGSRGRLTCPSALPRKGDRRAPRDKGMPSRLPGVAKELTNGVHDGGQALGSTGKSDADSDLARTESAACASGSTWAGMSRSVLTKQVLAISSRLGLSEGMSVLDAGATCGHALTILQERHGNKLRAMGVDGSRESMRYARRTSQGTFCVGDVRRLVGVADDTFDVAYTMGTLSELSQERDVCSVARELGRVLRPGGRAMIVSVPKPLCAETRDVEWGCPRCYWKLPSIDKGFWAKCLQLQAGGGSAGAGGAYRVEIIANTLLFPTKPATYCHREHYSVIIHKKSPASVYIFQQPRAKLAVLTVASTPPIGEYGKQKVHYLTELSIENKRQYCAQHGFELVIAQNLAHGRTARWDKVMLLRRMLAQYQCVPLRPPSPGPHADGYFGVLASCARFIKAGVHWVDLDTLFMNLKRSPLEFLDGAFDLHVAKDANGLNTGSFYVRASPWSHDFLRRVWEHADGGRGESDQRSFAHVISELSATERGAHVKYYSQKLFNEYPDPIVSFKGWRGHFREGDFLLHFPGTFCGLSPSGVYTDSHLLSCLHRFTIHFVAAM